jgi:putative phage-type endonuclease
MTAGIELLPYEVDRAKWLAARRQGIGGSDIAALLGISNWMSPYGLWISKMEQIPDEPSEAMRWGTVLEAPILDELWTRLGTVDIRRQGITRHADHDWARYSPDAVLDNGGTPAGLVEIKTSLGPRAHSIWAEGEIPEHVWCQVQWGLEVLDLPGAVVAALITGPTLLEHEVERDEVAGQQLVEIAAEWWDRHITGRVPPAIDGHPATTALLKRIPVRTGMSVELDPDVLLPLLTERRAAQRNLKAARQWADRIDNQLRALLGEHDEGLLHGERVVTCREVTRKEHTVAAGTHRRLHITQEHS